MSFRALARNLRQGQNRVRTRFFTEFTLNEVNVFRMTKIGFSTLSIYVCTIHIVYACQYAVKTHRQLFATLQKSGGKRIQPYKVLPTMFQAPRISHSTNPPIQLYSI